MNEEYRTITYDARIFGHCEGKTICLTSREASSPNDLAEKLLKLPLEELGEVAPDYLYGVVFASRPGVEVRLFASPPSRETLPEVVKDLVRELRDPASDFPIKAIGELSTVERLQRSKAPHRQGRTQRTTRPRSLRR